MRALLTLARSLLPPLPDRNTRRAWLQLGAYWCVAIALWLLVAAVAYRAERRLGQGAVITGYALFVVMLALGAFNLRKRLPALPLGTARAWMIAHAALGAVAIPLYFQHSGGLWPAGRYEQLIAVAFYVTAISGIFGYFLEWLLPRRLTDLGDEVVFERIPAEIAALRERVEALIVEAMQEAGSSTLGRYYSESLDWYFWRPRFLLANLVGSNRSARWLRGHISALHRYLNERERLALDQIEALALRKSRLDAHYVLQGTLKLWLFAHVPAAGLLVALALWHLMVVNIYAL
jgi:hypothetical protein